MISLWWLALPVLLLPVWWHRQKRERAASEPLATARFLPRTNPLHRRVWRWHDRSLLLLRCLLLATVIAWLADLVLPWRGDAVLIAPGTDVAWAEHQIRDAKFSDATRIHLQEPDVFGWLAKHEREWKTDARLMVIGHVPMPAAMPRFSHAVTVKARPAAHPRSEHRVSIVSNRPEKWRLMFDAIDGPRRYLVQTGPAAAAELIVWDLPDAPPPQLRAPLWWIGDPSAFPELKNAKTVDRLRYADSPRGRLWASDAWPPVDANAARAQFETWQRLHYAPVAWPTPTQTLPAASTTSNVQASGALRYLLTIALLVLFSLERLVTHAKRR